MWEKKGQKPLRCCLLQPAWTRSDLDSTCLEWFLVNFREMCKGKERTAALREESASASSSFTLLRCFVTAVNGQKNINGGLWSDWQTKRLHRNRELGTEEPAKGCDLWKSPKEKAGCDSRGQPPPEPPNPRTAKQVVTFADLLPPQGSSSEVYHRRGLVLALHFNSSRFYKDLD